SRKMNEEIIIGNNVTITIVGVRGNRVRLGIAAPECISIQRSELVPLATPACDSSLMPVDPVKPALC
ncbi:MAG TPA: carbon storage regulator, partial [Planctomycetaceae bacterium]|nr:carbon storage regulator [Planctomycetaceae bacterium]